MKLLSLKSRIKLQSLFITNLGSGSWGKVLAVRWQMGELDRNFITMQTSSGDEENIIGDKCIAELKKTMREYHQGKKTSYLRGGWGSSSSWLGVCPKDLTWFSMASLITGSMPGSRSTAPS